MSTISPSNKVETAHESKCAHCGLPSPAVATGEFSFCCEGCRGAYFLIRSWGLEDYYALRDQLAGNDPLESVARLGRFDELDDFEALGESAPVACAGGLLRSRLAIQGLHCAACAWLIERAANTQPGWHSARVRLNDHTLDVVFDPQTLRLSELGGLLGRLGYQVSPLMQGDRQARTNLENRDHLIRIAVAGFCAANAMWVAVALYAGDFSGMESEYRHLLHAAGVVLSSISVAFPGRVFFRGAWAAIKTRTPHMDLPIALGIGVGAVASVVAAVLGHGESYFDSVAMLVFLLLVGRWIQFRQQRKTSESVAMLMRLTPRHANKLGANAEPRRVLADLLKVGDQIRVDAGEVFPADAVITAGDSQVDRSLVTGESTPVDVSVGDKVEAGSCNLSAKLDLEVQAVGNATRVGRIASLIEEAAIHRAPIVQLADAIGGRFVKIVLAISVIVFAGWSQYSLSAAVGHTVALLIVACPCALALATPLAISMAIGRSAKRGILIRGADSLERINRPGIVWFDKTGTLTEGKIVVREWEGDHETLALAAAIEQHSQHPIALSIVRYCQHTGIAIPSANGVRQITGLGMEGTVGWHSVLVGNEKFLTSSGISIGTDDRQKIDAIATRGFSPLLVAVDSQLAGIATVGDLLRPESSNVVQKLKVLGWKVGILSGDHPATVQSIACELGIERALTMGGVSPEAKLAQIRASKTEGHSVLMVGDGVNDAAALAAADVGIAIRGGAAASLDAAPVYLAGGRLNQLTDLVQACHNTVNTIRRNFLISLSYNILAVSLAATGYISPLIAAILMPISSLTILSITVAARTYR